MIEDEDQINKKRNRISGDYFTKHFAPYAFNKLKYKYPNLKPIDVYRAITGYYALAQEDLSLGKKINLKLKLGNFYVAKEKREVKYDPQTDKIINNLPINLAASLKLWRNRPDLRMKTYVRYTNEHSNGYLFSLHYETSKAVFKNKSIYVFQFNEKLKEKLNLNIIDKKVDAYLINKKEKDE